MKTRSLALLALLYAPLAPSAYGEHGDLPWFEGSYEELVEAASDSGKPIMVDFWTTWCTWCKKLDKDTFSDATVVSEMSSGFLVFNIDAETEAGRPLAARFGVTGFPALVFLDSEGKAAEKLSGYMEPELFLSEARRILRNEDTVPGLRKQLEARPEDVNLRGLLAQKLKHVGDIAAAQAEVTRIVELDPKGHSFAMHRVALDRALATVPVIWRKTKKIDLSAVETFLAGTTYPELLHEGWGYIANTRYNQARQGGQRPGELRRQAREAYAQAWQHVSVKDLASFGKRLVRTFWEQRMELTEEDRRFAQRVANIACAAAPEDADLQKMRDGLLQESAR